MAAPKQPTLQGAGNTFRGNCDNRKTKGIYRRDATVTDISNRSTATLLQNIAFTKWNIRGTHTYHKMPYILSLDARQLRY
jgi:hypothetical protein